MIKRKVDALFISDVHLGSKGSNAKQLLETLKQYLLPKNNTLKSVAE